MNCESQALGAAVVLGIVHIVLQANALTQARGVAYNLGPRDEAKPLDGLAGRLERASKNYQETFPFFAAAVLLVLQTGSTGPLSQWGVCLYLAGRVVYLPLYVFGVAIFRTLSWFVAVSGIALLLVAAFSGG